MRYRKRGGEGAGPKSGGVRWGVLGEREQVGVEAGNDSGDLGGPAVDVQQIAVEDPHGRTGVGSGSLARRTNDGPADRRDSERHRAWPRPAAPNVRSAAATTAIAIVRANKYGVAACSVTTKPRA